MESEEYFGLLIFLDYLTNVLMDDDRILKNLREIYGRIKKIKSNFELSSDLVIFESALSAKEVVTEYKSKAGKDYFKECAGGIKKRYDQRDYVLDFNSKSTRQTDLYYDAIGLVIYNLFTDENKEELSNIQSKEDLEALLFTDYVMKYLKDKDAREIVRENVKRHDYLTASIDAINGLQKEAPTSLKEFTKSS
jgi:hypothetical protein